MNSKAEAAIQLRRLARMTQRDVARGLGMSPQRLSDIERGNLPPPRNFDGLVREAIVAVLNQRLQTLG